MTKTAEGFSLVIVLYLALAFFSGPHLIDDFLFGIPGEFGLSVHLTQTLGGVFMVIYLSVLIPLARGKKAGLISAAAMGSFLALAGFLKHVPLILQPGPYWSGWFSEGLIMGMIAAGMGVTVAAILALSKRSGR